MNPSLGYVVAMSIAFSAVVMAQQTAMGEEEKQIRALIVAEDAQKAPPASEDRIFWSGAIKRPIVGRERGEEIPSDRQPANRVTGSQRTKTTVRRIEIAKSGDLAYEFSDVQLSFQLQNGRQESFPSSILRVWKKDAGQWKVAAHFARPHYEELAAGTAR